MFTIQEAKRLAHSPKIKTRDQLLIMLALEPINPLTVTAIKERGSKAGLTKLARLNVSDILARSKGLAARTPEGWELLQPGVEHVRELALTMGINLVVNHASSSLRKQVEALSDPLTKSFVKEAINCFEAHQFRAAVVFSWAGAVALLHQNVFSKKLAEFNIEALKRDAKWHVAKQQDDLGRMKEHDFLDICERIGILGKNVKQILQNECLALRNGCGHPNTLSIAENSVAAHIEKLIKNVFARF